MKNFIKKPWVIAVAAVVVIIVGYFIFGRKSAPAQNFVIAIRGNIVQEVSVTGNVKPVHSVDLAFEKSGKVQRVYADVGDQVSSGQILVQLDNSELSAQLAKAQADSVSQQSELNKAQVILSNYYDSVVDVLNDAYTKANDAIRNRVDVLFSNPETNPKLAFSVSNSQDQVDMESQRLTMSATLTDWLKSLNQLNADLTHDVLSKALNGGQSKLVSVRNFLNLAEKTVTDSINVPQATANIYRDNINTGKAEVDTALSNVNGKNQDINAQEATIAAEQASVKSYEASIDNIKAQLAKTSLYSPINGVVTEQDAKVGQIAAANTNITSVISSSQFDVEAYIPEADIAKINVGNSADITLDAYGSDIVFRAKVVKIDPGETVTEGVATYKTTLQFNNEDARVKSGMTANIDILANKKENVLIVPQRAITSQDGDKTAKILGGNGAVKEVTVKLGLRGSDGNVEVLEGIKEGDKVIVSTGQ
jgi:HlyD family secretion protein